MYFCFERPAASSQGEWEPETDAAAKKRVVFDNAISKVTADDYSAYTPASQQQRFAERWLLRDLYLTSEWIKVADAWNAGLIPPGKLIRNIVTREVFLVMKVYAVAVVLWPAVQLQLNLFQPDLSINQLAKRCIYDLSEWEELPFIYSSPWSCYLQDFRLDSRLANRSSSALCFVAHIIRTNVYLHTLRILCIFYVMDLVLLARKNDLFTSSCAFFLDYMNDDSKCKSIRTGLARCNTPTTALPLLGSLNFLTSLFFIYCLAPGYCLSFHCFVIFPSTCLCILGRLDAAISCYLLNGIRV
jgi:hypothetical protein